jgi:hypothetical protein
MPSKQPKKKVTTTWVIDPKMGNRSVQIPVRKDTGPSSQDLDKKNVVIKSNRKVVRSSF